MQYYKSIKVKLPEILVTFRNEISEAKRKEIIDLIEGELAHKDSKKAINDFAHAMYTRALQRRKVEKQIKSKGFLAELKKKLIKDGKLQDTGEAV